MNLGLKSIAFAAHAASRRIWRVPTGITLLVLLAGPVAAHGQTDVQKDNAASTSKPDDSQIPEANPARPTVTNPAHLPPVGYLQFEQGFVQANLSPGLDRQFSLNQVTKLAVHPRLMVEFLSQPFAASTAGGSQDRAEGDLQLGGQVVLFKEAGHFPEVAAAYIRRVRGGSAADLDVGSFSDSALVLASGDLGEFHYDTNFVVSKQDNGIVRRAQFGETLSVTHDLWKPTIELSGELWHFSQPLVTVTYKGAPHGSSSSTGMLWALGYSARPNLVLDAGFEHGLTSTSTQWQGFAGFTYLLPHRLWPHRQQGKPKARRHTK